MKARSIVTLLLLITSGAVLWGVITQGREISVLRIEKARLGVTNSVTTTHAASTDAVPSPTPEVPRELLQLRAEVARLSQQQRELAGARPENQKLRLQLENRRTNSTALNAGGGRYLRMSEVKWRGYNTPEDTLQSCFWALQNHDLGKYLEALRPDDAKDIADRLRSESRSADEFFKDKQLPPIFRIVGRQQNDEEVIDLQVEIAPDIPTLTIDFRRVGEQWKLGSRF
jgi:hypothetical protein